MVGKCERLRDGKGSPFSLATMAAATLTRLGGHDDVYCRPSQPTYAIMGLLAELGGTDIQEKDEKQSQNDKTGLGMEKTVKDKAKSKPESQSSQKVNRKVNWSKSKSTQVNPEAKVTEI
ncbi:hypothetical protein Tco_0775229 [Tanacetum coccineum]